MPLEEDLRALAMDIAREAGGLALRRRREGVAIAATKSAVADIVTEAGRDPSVGAVVLRADGRGFNAGVDIKEMQNSEGFEALIGANRGCYAAFAAVYECEVPVIAAVHGFCLGGGIGLVGNADVIVAAEGTRFGSPR